MEAFCFREPCTIMQQMIGDSSNHVLISR